MTRDQRLTFLRPIIAQAFSHVGLPPTLGLALARQESDFRVDAVATHPADIARGGAYGALQMTLKTARGLGYQGPPEGLLDATENARWAAELCAQNAKRTKAPIGSQDWVYDLAAMYNSGRPFAKAPEVTRKDYAPRVWSFYKEYAK